MSAEAKTTTKTQWTCKAFEENKRWISSVKVKCSEVTPLPLGVSAIIADYGGRHIEAEFVTAANAIAKADGFGEYISHKDGLIHVNRPQLRLFQARAAIW